MIEQRCYIMVAGKEGYGEGQGEERRGADVPVSP
jgi:hypothetical protein